MRTCALGWLRKRKKMMRWISLLFLLLPAIATAKNEKLVSLVVDDVPVAQVLQTLAEMQQKNLVAPDVSGTVSLHLKNVPWQQALRAVIDSAGLMYNQQGTVLHVHTLAWQNARQAQEAARAKQLQNLPLQRHSAMLQHADASELAVRG
jgi:protein transport protein HofQ